MVARADRHTHRALTKGKRGKNGHAHASWKLYNKMHGGQNGTSMLERYRRSQIHTAPQLCSASPLPPLSPAPPPFSSNSRADLGAAVIEASFSRGNYTQRHSQHLEVVRPVSPETSSHVWVPRCPDLMWSSPFRMRHRRNSGLRDAAREVVRPVSTEISSHLWAARCRSRGGLGSFA